MKHFFHFVISLLLLAAFSFANAQQNLSLSGQITDSQTGEDIIGATLFDPVSGHGTISNTYGFYSLSLTKGSYKISVSFLGYKTVVKEIILESNTKLNIELTPDQTLLQEVVVSADRTDANVSSTQMSMEKLSMKQIEALPVLLGEKDILKTIQLLPGISTASEGSTGFSVRGGSTDQNLILLDEAPVYSASHLMGFFSVFNSDALKDMAVYKGGIPSNFGGRASSVLDIQMKDGNSKNFAGSGGIGLISSRLTLEGPIVKDKASFVLAGRRSYADLVGKAIGKLESDMTLYFYDFNAKFNYKIDDNNRIFVSGYLGQDKFGFGAAGMGWGNTTATARWNRVANPRLFSNTTLIYSNFDYSFKMGDFAEMSAGIVDWSLKQDYTWYASASQTLKFGGISTYHTFNPGQMLFTQSNSLELVLDEKYALESALYISNNHKISDAFSAEYGLRFSMFNQFGAGVQKQYNALNEPIAEKAFSTGQIMQTYYEFEPRASVTWQWAADMSVKASYTRMAQYLHQLSNSTSGQPTDTWMPSSQLLKPTLADQFAFGYFQNFLDNSIEFSLEGYYKMLQNQYDYEDGTDITLNEDVEAYILEGLGRSYGLEFYLKKNQGRFTGWLSYTHSQTQNKIAEVNNGAWYSSRFDKTHDISLVGSFKITDSWSLAATWVYSTGNAVTFPSGKYEYSGQSIPYYTERNGYRMPSYHRLDFNLHWSGNPNRKFKSSWDISVYNAYNRHNAYSITFRESETTPGTTEAVRTSLFGIVPSITWNFEF